MAKTNIRISEKALKDLETIKKELLMPWNLCNGFDIGYGITGKQTDRDGDSWWVEMATNIDNKEKALLFKRLSEIVCELTRQK